MKTDVRITVKEILRFEGTWRYLIPFFFYMLTGDILNLIGAFPEDYRVYIAYALRTLIVGSLIYGLRNRFPEISKEKFSLDKVSILLGFLIFLIWIGLEGHYPQMFKSDAHYDPAIFSGYLYVALIVLRLVGSVLVAPFMEELFMRSFLIRYIIDQDWESVPIGKYTFESFAIIALVFGFSHFRWLPGILTAIILNLLLYKRQKISACITAHSTANLFLFVYVLSTGNWFYY